jgi:hypothetical protein
MRGPSRGGIIIISYRQQEASQLVGRLFARLADHFGHGQVFINIDSGRGVDFAEVITRALSL